MRSLLWPQGWSLGDRLLWLLLLAFGCAAVLSICFEEWHLATTLLLAHMLVRAIIDMRAHP